MASSVPDQNGKATAAADDDDLDDLDDIVDQFDAPAPAPKAEPEPASVMFPPGVRPPSASVEDAADSDEEELDEEDDDQFARDLAEGMDALLSGLNTGDDAEFAKKFEALMRGDPDAAAGIFGGAAPPPTGPMPPLPTGGAKGKSAAPAGAGSAAAGVGSSAGGAAGGTKTFQDTIMETMNKLKESDTSATAKSNSDEDMMAALMEQFMGAAGGEGSDQDLQSMLQGFMDELMSKAIMYQPMKELNEQYPPWLEAHRAQLSPPELDRYTTQSQLISRIVALFEDPSWDADETAAPSNPQAKERLGRRQAEVTELMTKMQECGSPPKEIMGEMPEGMQLGEDGMPDMEKCVIA